MLSKEFLAEFSAINPGIPKMLRQKGYKFLGKGIDMQAWLEPKTGLIVKIFGAPSHSSDRHQQSFKDFAAYCMKNPNNPFLPQIFEWKPFEFEDETYLRIKMERLFPFHKTRWGDFLEALGDMAESYPNERGKKKFLDAWVDVKNADRRSLEAFSYLGDKFDLLWKTLCDLAIIANRKRYQIDLHSKNWMMGSDGQIVISDPFYVP